ncbi:MAG: hypothetical protein HFI17_08355 [Lachnospiraceae bacterium]|nr:hypothetical protein [Lachnospiraceae bacterium]
MIKTFEDLLEKLEACGRCRSVPETKWNQIKAGSIKLQDMKKEEQAVFWMTGYLFCLSDEGCISDAEWNALHSLLMEKIS